MCGCKKDVCQNCDCEAECQKTQCCQDVIPDEQEVPENSGIFNKIRNFLGL